MRILIVDDSEDARDLTEGTLLSGGYDDVVTAASGWDALKVLDIGRNSDERPSVDIVLLDIVMPEMDGVEACARIRNDPRYADLPIIMVTSVDDVSSLTNAFVAGATDYVVKPVNRMELIARVRAALRLKAELDRRLARERELLGFLSSWGNRRASLWIDEATGLFVGEVAEAYLTSATGYESNESMSVLALTIDRLEGYRSAQGDSAANGVLVQVARAVRRLAANIGIVAASYRNGMIVLVAPEFGANSARELGEALHSTVSKLRLPNSESIVSDHVTASVAAVTGKVRDSIERVHLLTQASDVRTWHRVEQSVLKRCVGAGLGVLVSPCAAFAGAWTLPAGSGQAVVTTTASSANGGFDGSGLTPTPRYDKLEVQGLIEYGITDRLTAIGAPGLQHVEIASPTDAQRTELGYTKFGGRYRLLQVDSWVPSGQSTIRVPGTNDTSNPAAIGCTGVETDIRGLIGYGFTFRAMPAFVDLQVAQRFRAGAPPNELRADATFGVQVAPQWLLMAESFNVVSEGAGSAPFASYEYYKFQLSAVYSLTASCPRGRQRPDR